MGRVWLLWGCIFGFLTVLLGTFAAHGLQQMFEPQKLEIIHTANRYLAYHAFALLALGLWSHWEKWSSSLWVGLCFVMGIILFSGSLYVYVLFELKAAAMVAPVGGTLFMLGWLLFAFTILRTKNSII